MKMIAKASAAASLIGFAVALGTAAAADEHEAGKAFYEGGAAPSCATCHDRGIGGAPMIHDMQSWEDRAIDDPEQMAETVQDGKGAMPAYADRADHDELLESIEYMLSTLD